MIFEFNKLHLLSQWTFLIVFSGTQAFRVGFGKAGVYRRLAGWLNLMARYENENHFLSTKIDVIADYISQSIGLQSNEADSTNFTVKSFLATKRTENECSTNRVLTVEECTMGDDEVLKYEL